MNKPYVKQYDEMGLVIPITGYITKEPLNTRYHRSNRKVSSTKVGAGNHIQLLDKPNKYGNKSIRHIKSNS
jgi:hypothetical protein